MAKQENRAWFIADDGRAPQTLYVVHDSDASGLNIYFRMGEKFNSLRNKIPYIFNVTDNKWAKPEHILKWDFLPNSTGVPLANAKALALLEELAHGDFEAIPTEIRMPDGSIIHDYKLINILNKIEMNDGIDFERSILKSERFRTEKDKYKTYCYKLDCLGEKHLGVCDLSFLGSSQLKNELKARKITGLILRNYYADSVFLEE